ncbi:SHOCT domain-containing protein [Halosolutus amylolyticus]|uniref:SHOCT domain-containing protein n=1 Tax=Halosolutus amylolyticus TaxID=2932267 RepID=A0ABD5PNN3_9EURY|nr:SHOCT domain-containing protein [Halosolutus amylolyticus]
MSDTTSTTRPVVIVLALIAALVVLPGLFMGIGMMGFGPMMGGWSHMWGDGSVPGWMPFVGVLMQLLFLAALVGLGYLLVRAIAGTDERSDRALEELRLAYARGELSDEEYEQRRDALERTD